MYFKLFSFIAWAAFASSQSITSVLSGAPELSNLTALVSQYPNLVEALKTTPDITILAPSNDAIAKLLASPLGKSLAAEPKLIEAILSYHVVTGKLATSEFKTTPVFLPTGLTAQALTNVTGGQVVEAFRNDNQLDIVSGLTVSHVVKGDIKFDNGLVHIIDQVLNVPRNISTTARVAKLTDLVGALKVTNLVNTIDTIADLTVFAPNNAAFEKLGPAAAKLTVQQLTTILGNHVVKGPVGYSSKLKNGETFKTLGGASVKITVSGGNVFVNNAKVLVPDLLVANGVVHVIDSVLIADASSANSTVPVGTSTATGVPGPPSGTGVASSPPTSSPIVPYRGAASSLKSGVIGAVAFVAGTVAWFVI